VLRRWYRSKGLIKQVTVMRVEQSTGRVRCRRSHKRKRLMTHNRGFIVVNDGPLFASQLARYLAGLESPSPRPATGGCRVPLPDRWGVHHATAMLTAQATRSHY
jgi:hypothetical protein